MNEIILKKEKCCGFVVFRMNNGQRQYLLIFQSNNVWSFPKGHVEEGESELETAIRELREETDLTVNKIDNFREEIVYCFLPNIEKTVVFFLGEADGQKPNVNTEYNIDSNEVLDFVWLDRESAIKRLSYNDLKEVLVKADDFFNKDKFKAKLKREIWDLKK